MMERKLPPGQRTPEEDVARGRCRSLVRSQGARLFKVERTHVCVSECSIWPQGLVTAFHGWVELYDRLEFCRDNPDYVTDGIYVREDEAGEELPAAREAKILAEDYPHVGQQRELSQYS